MSAPSSVEELLQLIRKSGMVDDQKLTGYLQRRHAGRGLPADPREAADALIADGILTNFQAEQFMLGKWRGFTIGKYKLLERVGVGGMGQVFLCEHMFMKRRVAVKVLPPAKAEQPAALGRFYREARAAGSLEHPNIVRTHDIDQDGNLHFIVMEYVDGSNLLDIVKRFGPMDVGRAVVYAQQAAIGLDFAFRSGIIHRDVKPGNVLVDRRGRAKVLDLGLARFYKDQNDLLTVKYDDKIVLGTADYVAPEQVANSHAVDVRADVYGLGATLYFLLAGHPPFPAGTVSQKLLWHRTKEPTPIRQVRPEVPEALAAVVARMMAKDPRARYQTPAEAAAALQPFIPAHVLPPTAEEMPQLCPAVADLLGDGEVSHTDTLELKDEPTGEPAAAIGSSVAKAPAVRPQPFAPPPGPFAPLSTPGGRAGLLAPPAPGPATANPPARSATPAVPFASPLSSGPRPGLEPTPQPARRSPASAPLPAFVNQDGPTPDPKAYKLAVAALVGAFVVLGGGLLYWKFGKPAEVPVPTAPER
jgi:serine/threonine protein kinase